MTDKIKITPVCRQFLAEMDEYVRRNDIRGEAGAFSEVAPDVLDGWALRGELDGLVRQRLLRVHRYKGSEIEGEDRERDPEMCGTRWTVEVTARLAAALWPDRLEKALPQPV